MSIASFFEKLFSDLPDASAAAITTTPTVAITAVKTFAGSEASKIIAGLKTTDIGAAVIADIAVVESTDLTGAQKFEQVVANTAPLILKYVTGGGIAAVESDVLGIAQGLVQTVYLDVQSTSFAKLAGPLLKLLGL